MLTVSLAVTLSLLCSSLSYITKATDEDLVNIVLGDDTAYNKGEVSKGVEFSSAVAEKLTQSISLFRDSYYNDSGNKIAESNNGDVIIAPGIEYAYRFRLQNVGSGKVDYTFTLSGTDKTMVGGEHVSLPIEFRLKTGDGAYLIGSDEEWVDIEQLSGVEAAGDIGVNFYSIYVLDWRWNDLGTEEGDSFDTTLGNLALSEDIDITINIKAIAYASDNYVTSWLSRMFLDENGRKNEKSDIIVGGFAAALVSVSVITVIVVAVKIRRIRIKRRLHDAPDYYMYY